MHDTGRSFAPIFVKFTSSVRLHPWPNPIVFGDNRPNITPDTVENVRAKPAFWLSYSRYGGY